MFRVLAAAIAVTAFSPALAEPTTPPLIIAVTLKDHRFSPDVINIPAGQRVKIDITNHDATADDFDSDDLHIDKDIAPHGRVAFFIGPLKAGIYAFKGELHAATAHGTVVAVDTRP